MSKTVDTRYTQERELSWLRFNERVLEEAGRLDYAATRSRRGRSASVSRCFGRRAMALPVK